MHLLSTDIFGRWLRGLFDARARAEILVRLRRLGLGNPGDAKPVGQEILEMRIDYDSGYRVYYTVNGPFVLLLFCGSDKKAQRRDVEQAKAIALRWRA